MCILVDGNADLSNTAVYAAKVVHPTEGPVHVIGYQNFVTGNEDGPNAMILPVPTDAPFGQGNILNTQNLGFHDVMSTYRKAVHWMRPRRRSLDTLSIASSNDADFQVFDSGPYTIALAENASSLSKALQIVPARKRPEIGDHFLVGLTKAYPNTPLAICCFNSRDFLSSGKPDPLFYWYKPRNLEILVAPAIDAHNGKPPKNKKVKRDHTVIFGSYDAEKVCGRNSLLDSLPKHWALTTNIVGSQINNMKTNNGDFVFPISALSDAGTPNYMNPSTVSVNPPPGWRL